MSCAFVLHFQILMKNGIFTILLTVFMCVCSCGSAQCHELIVISLHNPKDFSSLLSKSFPSSYADCVGVLGSSSSCFSVPFFYSTNVSWFASYFKIGNSYSSPSRSLSFFSHFYLILLLMNIGMLCSSPINILLGIINKSCNCGLIVWLVRDCLHELVASFSQNPNQTSVSL
jgi:hypothetical protein